MKTLAITLGALVCAVILLTFTMQAKSTNNQDATEKTYVIVTYKLGTVYIHYGGNDFKEVPVKEKFFEDNSHNALVDVLNSLHEQGYDVVTGSNHSYTRFEGTRSYEEYSYTLRKREP
jgi:hypothetical protein